MANELITRPILLGIKRGKITEEDRKILRQKAWRKASDCMTHTIVFNEQHGYQAVLVLDVYVVKQLSIFKRLRHTFRVIKTAISGYIGIYPGIVVVTLK